MQDHPEYIDVVKLILPKPLLPGDSISISASFHLRFPLISMGTDTAPIMLNCVTGIPNRLYMTAKGWHPMPFLVQGGAIHEAADYAVEIEAPAGIPNRSRCCCRYSVSIRRQAICIAFPLQNANAFAWIADTRYLVKTDSLQMNAGQPVRVTIFLPPRIISVNSSKLLAEAKNEIRQFSEWLTPYPHGAISLVQAESMEDQDFSGLVCIGVNPENNWQASLRKGLAGTMVSDHPDDRSAGDALAFKGIYQLL